MSEKKKKVKINKEKKELLLRELDEVNNELKEATKQVDLINDKLKNINDTIFLGHHDLKMLKLELKNKEIELEEKKAFNMLSNRKVDNVVNKYVLKCYENFLTTATQNELEVRQLSQALEIQKLKQISDTDYEKLTTITEMEHLKEIKFLFFSQNQIIEQMNKTFNDKIKEIRRNYFQKVDLEREKLDKKRIEDLLNLQMEKNEEIRILLADYNEKVLNGQKYFKQILEDHIEMIQELEVEKLNKQKNYTAKVKQLEELKKKICVHTKKLNSLNREVALLDKNTEDYEKLKKDLKKIKERKIKQTTLSRELKFETDVKKMLYQQLVAEYEKIYAEQKMKLFVYLQKLILENYFLEMKIKMKEECLAINTLELNKWKESLDVEENETLNRALNLKFQNFQLLKQRIENLMNENEKAVHNFEALIRLHHGSEGNLDILKRENDI